MTLRQLLEQHPEWADLPLTVAREDGSIDYIGAAGLVYLAVGEENEYIITFAPN